MALKKASLSETLAALLFLFLTGSTGCPSGLPPFSNYRGAGQPPDSMHAIIPGYRFTCSGKIIQWGACFRPGAYFDRYYVSYQVWRERLPGCFYLVGSNSPRGTGNNDLLTLEGRCNMTSIPHDEQISVQDGDIVGFYSDHWEELFNGGLSNTQYRSGVQILIGSYNTTIYINRLSSLQDMRASYAVGTGPESCAALPDFSGHEVDETFVGAPVITAVIGNVESHGKSPRHSSVTSLQAPHHMTTTTHHVTITTHHMTTTTATVLFSISPSTTTTPRVHHGSRSSGTRGKKPIIIGGSTTTASGSPSLLQSSHVTMSTAQLFSAALSMAHTVVDSSRGTSYNVYNSMVHVLAASLVVLFTVLMVLVAILAIVLFRRRAGQRRTETDLTIPRLEFESSELSQDRSTPDGGDDSAKALQTEYQLLNRSQDRISVLSNGLYATSPVIGLRNKATGERSGSNAVRLDQPRLNVDSMIYNGVYGSYSGSGEGASPLRTVQPDSEEDCGGYELVKTTTT